MSSPMMASAHTFSKNANNMTAFDKIFEQSYACEYEKGTSNAKNDKGGLTNDGITWDNYFARCKIVLNRRPTKAHFKALTKAEIKAFYRYIWDLMQLDNIKSPVVAGICFDFALNSKYGKREIQEVLHDDYQYTRVKADNIFGPITIAAINYAVSQFGSKRVATDILDKRQRYLNSLVKADKTQENFINGWTNRVESWRDFTAKWLKEASNIA